jgi:DNA-binding transcriptional LysR family regulator
MAINKTWLGAFHAVATAGSFSRAATERSVSQSTLSAQVSSLEKAYGVQLFDRSTRRVELTPIGDRLLQVTARMISAEGDAEEILSSTHLVEKGELRLGADRPVLASELMARFAEHHPAMQMTFRVGNSTELEKGVEDHQLDMAIVAKPILSRRLRSKFLVDEPVSVIVGKQHPLARQKSISFRGLADRTIIIRERGSRLREIIDEQFLELEIQPSQVIEVDDWQAAREFAARNLGCALVPESELASDRRNVVLNLHGPMKSLPAYLVFRAEHINHRTVATFVKLINDRSA